MSSLPSDISVKRANAIAAGLSTKRAGTGYGMIRKSAKRLSLATNAQRWRGDNAH
jgi:hypothetical protein